MKYTKLSFDINADRESILTALNNVATQFVQIVLDDDNKFVADRCKVNNNKIADVVMSAINKINEELHEIITADSYEPTDDVLEKMYRRYEEENSNKYDCEDAMLHHMVF